MLFHITITVLVNIAIELDYLNSLPPEKNSSMDFLLDKVTSEPHRCFSSSEVDTRRKLCVVNSRTFLKI